MSLSIAVLYQKFRTVILMCYSGSILEHVINISCHDNLNIVVFFNILRSFRVCVHARVFVHAYESGRNYIHACNKKFFEGIMLVENEPPATKAGYGPGRYNNKSALLCVHSIT